MSFRAKCRDVIRGAIGVYLIENRLAEIRDLMEADGCRKIAANADLQKLEQRVALLDQQVAWVSQQAAAVDQRVSQSTLAAEQSQHQVAELSRLLAATKEESRRLQDNVRYAINRHVALTEFGGFPLYHYIDDWPYQQMIKNPNHRDTPLDEALAKIDAAHRDRVVARLNAEGVIAYHWQSCDVSFYNAIHRALLAVLAKEGRQVDFIDVGSCIGDTALYAADVMIRLGIEGHVHAFEPGPVFELARANVYLNGLQAMITLHHVAASERNAYVPMRIPTSNSQSGSIVGIEKHKELPVGQTHMVRTVRLDEQFKDCPRDLYLKIDAEGHDFQVVRGAKGLIEAGRIPVIHLDFTPRYLGHGDIETLGEVCKSHDLFNLRALTVEGQFDRLDQVSPSDIPDFTDRVNNSPHGWADVALVDKALVNTASFALLDRGKQLKAA